MEKIKNLSSVILPEMACLVEVIKPKRLILSPDGTEDKDSYAVIIAMSPNIKDLSIGDIVIKYSGTMYGYTVNSGKTTEKQYAIMVRGCMNIVVKPDNFIDPDVITGRVTI